MKAKTKLRKYNKYIIIGSICMLVVGVGLSAFALATKDAVRHIAHNKSDDTAEQPTANDFTMVTTFGISYRATEITTYNDGQPDSTQIMDRDGTHGVSRLTSLESGKLSAKVFSDEVAYDCNSTSCKKVPWGGDASYADNTVQNTYDFSLDTVRNLKSRVTFKGEADCPAGRCLVWDAVMENTAGGTPYTQTLYIDKRTKSLSKIVRGNPTIGYVSTIVYDYTPRTISMPPASREIPAL